ncbi:hypothetical protein ACFWBB_00165 [Streptomyces sp. NPDC060000]|uniref:hypothetical protein n=1 Tax=Streptomyces sp. NPDC060000 TaxID=3347031 RepID=UPI0036C6FF94
MAAALLVVASRCPALPGILGPALPHERVTGRQVPGPTGAALAGVLPAPGRGHPHVAE